MIGKSADDHHEDREPLLTMSKNDVDPFYSVRDNVNGQIEKIKVRHDKFQDLIKNTDTSVNTEFKDLRKNLVKDLRTADKDLKGLKGAVDMVDKNRAKFPHIKDSELSSRKKFVDDAQNTINDIKASIDSQAVRRKIEDDERKGKRDSYDDNVNSGNSALHNENTGFIKDKRQQQQELVKKQDENLGQLGTAVDRLGEIGRGINEELKEQNVLLDKLGNEVDDASSRMNTVQAALEKLLKTKDGCQIWTIVILTFILILLVALIIWA